MAQAKGNRQEVGPKREKEEDNIAQDQRRVRPRQEGP